MDLFGVMPVRTNKIRKIFNSDSFRKTYPEIKKLKRMRYLLYLLLFSLCIACLSLAGCSQPGQSGIQVQPPTHTEQVTPSPAMQQNTGQQQYVVAITIQQQGDNLIVVFQGGPDTNRLLYCTVFVNGIELTKKLGNTPGDTVTLDGVTTKASDHVVVVGYFNDGSSQTIMDTRL
jgi:hypothetical protein